MKWKEFTADYFSFTRKERVGVVLMMLVIAGAIFLPFTFRQPKTISDNVDTSWLAAIERLEKKTPPDPGDQKTKDDHSPFNPYEPYRVDGRERPQPGRLFYFDPNTTSVNDWQKLGLGVKTIETIRKYLSKGGRFKTADDLGRIYSLRREDFQRLAPYVRIQQKGHSSTLDNQDHNNPASANYSRRRKLSLGESIDINTADTGKLMWLPGIGSRLAARIFNFRNKLGGFYSIEQVSETFGLPDSTYQKIRIYLKLENVTVKKININTATLDEMKSHPYLKYQIANAIVAYRNEHGPYTSLGDLKKLMIIGDDLFNKISPYLSL